MRIALATAVACLIGLNAAAADEALATIKRFTNIPAQELSAALQELAKDRKISVVYVAEALKGSRTQGAVGEYTAEEALKKLLDGTGLTYRYLNQETVTVVPMGVGSVSRSSLENGYSARPQLFASAQENPAQDHDARSESNADNQPTEEGKLAEVVVTAQKRLERAQDVPMAVTALDAQALADSHQVRLQDFYSSVPGLNFSTSGPGLQSVSIRGIASGSFQNPTVGSIIDDVPFGPSNGLAFAGLSSPDIDPGDLRDIEVLKGPQGTLYGAASIGGVLKYVTVDPSTRGVSGRVQGEVNSIENSDGAGYSVRGGVNLPVGDTFAVRLSGSSTLTPGYIDNPVAHTEGVNRTRIDGGRISALWTPSAAVSLKLSALVNDVHAHGTSDANALDGSGKLLQDALPGTGPYRQRLGFYTANLSAKLGNIDLVAVSGYQTYHVIQYWDYTPYYGFALPPFGVSGAADVNDIETRKFSQEVRLSSTIGRVDWLVGAFYTDESSTTDQTAYAADSGSVPPPGAGLLLDTIYPTQFAERAVFAGLTVHTGDRFDVQFGARQSANRQRYDEIDTGALVPLFDGGVSPLTFPAIHTKDSAFTYLITPRFKMSQDLMLYARIASGYRTGGPNQYASLFNFPSHYDADTTVNYEVGAKGEFLDHTLSLDASIYHIAWRDIQIPLVDPVSFFIFFTNASSAKSDGVELSGKARLPAGLTITAWINWNRAALTADLPNCSFCTSGHAGDALPNSKAWSGNLSVDDEIRLGGNLTGFAGASWGYVGERATGYSLVSPLPSYTKTDLRLGVRQGPWTLYGFLNNVADKRGRLSSAYIGHRIDTYIQPRTMGLSLARTF